MPRGARHNFRLTPCVSLTPSFLLPTLHPTNRQAEQTMQGNAEALAMVPGVLLKTLSADKAQVCTTRETELLFYLCVCGCFVLRPTRPSYVSRPQPLSLPKPLSSSLLLLQW